MNRKSLPAQLPQGFIIAAVWRAETCRVWMNMGDLFLRMDRPVAGETPPVPPVSSLSSLFRLASNEQTIY
jgi:hypothetical protein